MLFQVYMISLEKYLLELKSEWWVRIWLSDRWTKTSQTERTIYAKALVYGGCTQLFCSELHLLLFNFRWKDISSPIKNESFFLYSFLYLCFWTSIYHLFIFHILTTFPIKYFPSRYNIQISMTSKKQSGKQTLLWILHPSTLPLIFSYFY